MTRPVDQQEWDRRAQSRGIQWLEEVRSSRAKTRARCLTCSYEWETSPGSKAGCPACAGKNVDPQRWKEQWDERAAAVGIKWLEPVEKARTKAPARCLTCGHEWWVIPNNVQQGQGCIKCGGNLPVSQSEWQERARRAGLQWLEPVISSQTQTQARCLTCNYQWAAPPNHVSDGTGCPRCAGVVATAEDWELRAQAAGIAWLKPVQAAKSKTPALCLACGHEWEAVPDSISHGSRCPQCRLREASERSRLGQEEWDRRAAMCGYEWLEEVPPDGRTALARCLTCRHQWKAHKASTSRGSGCPNCAGKVVDQEEWNKRAARAEIRWTSPVVNASTDTPAQCLVCSFEWNASPNRIQQGGGCPKCAGRHITPEEWDLRAGNAGLEWLEPVGLATEPTMARCLKCGYESPKVPKLVSQGRGCVICADFGFNPTDPAVVYLLKRPSDQGLKVGISGQGLRFRRRMLAHSRNGYQLVRTWLFDEGHSAREVEKQTIQRWREDDLPPFAPRGEDGWTETVDGARINEATVIHRINHLAASCGGVPDHNPERR